MKHANSQSLVFLAGLLGAIRQRNGPIEKKPGIFYRKGKAFIHFHEDQAGLFMVIRDGEEWLRLPAEEAAQCLREIDRILATG